MRTRLPEILPRPTQRVKAEIRRRKLCDHSPPDQMVSTPHRAGYHCRSAVPGVLAVEKGCTWSASCESLACIKLARLTRASRERIARVLWQKVDVPFVIDIVYSRRVWHERRPAATGREIGEVQDAVDGFWLRVNPWYQNNVVATDRKHTGARRCYGRCTQVIQLRNYGLDCSFGWRRTSPCEWAGRRLRRSRMMILTVLGARVHLRHT